MYLPGWAPRRWRLRIRSLGLSALGRRWRLVGVGAVITVNGRVIPGTHRLAFRVQWPFDWGRSQAVRPWVPRGRLRMRDFWWDFPGDQVDQDEVCDRDASGHDRPCRPLVGPFPPLLRLGLVADDVTA